MLSETRYDAQLKGCLHVPEPNRLGPAALAPACPSPTGSVLLHVPRRGLAGCYFFDLPFAFAWPFAFAFAGCALAFAVAPPFVFSSSQLASVAEVGGTSLTSSRLTSVALPASSRLTSTASPASVAEAKGCPRAGEQDASPASSPPTSGAGSAGCSVDTSPASSGLPSAGRSAGGDECASSAAAATGASLGCASVAWQLPSPRHVAASCDALASPLGSMPRCFAMTGAAALAHFRWPCTDQCAIWPQSSYCAPSIFGDGATHSVTIFGSLICATAPFQHLAMSSENDFCSSALPMQAQKESSEARRTTILDSGRSARTCVSSWQNASVSSPLEAGSSEYQSLPPR
mmetsp:Transcript_27656/g.69992  ORF Transcript_27656/g.69992 Transcript_27656/m.69992 type:complete len:345 (+) Transcript_27656:332-1366(+)